MTRECAECGMEYDNYDMTYCNGCAANYYGQTFISIPLVELFHRLFMTPCCDCCKYPEPSTHTLRFNTSGVIVRICNACRFNRTDPTIYWPIPITSLFGEE